MSDANVSPPTATRYDIQRQKRPGELLGSAWKIWLSRPAVFIVAALAVVVPIELIVSGALGGGFSDPEGTPSEWWGLLDQLLVGWFGIALITAAHARAVVALAAGERVGTFSALRLGGGPFWTVLGASLIYGIFSGLGFILIIPGIWLTVSGMFSAQVAALTRTGPMGSFESSMALVKAAGWWRTFGYYLLVAVIGGVAALAIGAIPAAIGEASGDGSVSGPLYVIAMAVGISIFYSWTALVTTLLYFSWRAKVGDPWGAAASQHAPDLEAGRDWDPTESTALGHGG